MLLLSKLLILTIFSSGLAFPQHYVTKEPGIIHQVGDMVLDDFQFRMLSGSVGMDLSRNAIAMKRYRWTNGEVPYKFDEEIDVVPENVRNQIKNVIAEMNSQISGCTYIREATDDDENYVLVRGGENHQGKSCRSFVGMIGGPQTLYLYDTQCITKRTIQHEFLHAIGQYHVHQRPDRDEYIHVNYNNIDQKWWPNYDKKFGTLTFGVPYDGKSLMHYPSDGYNMYSLKPNEVPTYELGSSKVLRESDLFLLQRMYECESLTTTTPTSTTSITTGTSCANLEYHGDGFCDDGNNTPGCDYDGGDCCGEDVNTKYCEDCECLDPNANCQNKRKKCDLWASYGYCSKPFLQFMKKYCQKSCKLC